MMDNESSPGRDTDCQGSLSGISQDSIPVADSSETLKGQSKHHYDYDSSISSKFVVLKPNYGSVKIRDSSDPCNDVVAPQTVKKGLISSFFNRGKDLMSSVVETLTDRVGAGSSSDGDGSIPSPSDDAVDYVDAVPLRTQPPSEYPWSIGSNGGDKYAVSSSRNLGFGTDLTNSWSLRNDDGEELNANMEEYQERLQVDDDNSHDSARYGCQNESENYSPGVSSRDNQFWRFGSWTSSRENRVDQECIAPDSSNVYEGSGPTGVGAGLSNLGNSCFMNAILQCITHTVPMVEGLRSCSPKVPCSSESFCMHCALLYHINRSLALPGKIIEPVHLFRNLHNISHELKQGQQEDAHEFLMAILDLLERFERSQLMSGDIVERVFGVRIRRRYECSHCGHHSDQYEQTNHLNVVLTEGVATLQNDLEQTYTMRQKLEDSTCDNCMEKGFREVQETIDRAPTIVFFSLKRYKYSDSYYEKIGEHMKFPLELDLSPYTCHSQDNVNLKYQLYAVVVHDGYSSTFGHYYSYIRSSPNTWNELNDSTVVRCTEETVLSQSAYLLFYAREGVPWPSSLIESKNLCLGPVNCSFSPKSVLERIDYESALGSNMVNPDKSENNVNGDAAVASLSLKRKSDVVNEVGDVAVKDLISHDEKRPSKQDSVLESEDDVPMVEAAELPTSSACHDNSLSNDKLMKNVCNREATDVRTNETQIKWTTKSSSSSPEARHNKPHHHLEVKNKVNFKRKSNSPKDKQKIEAFRYVKKMPSARGNKLLAALTGSPSKSTISGGCRSYRSAVAMR